MDKVNELFGKRVIDMYTGNQIAAVRDVVIDEGIGKIVALVVGNSGWGRQDKVLRWEEVVGAGEFVIVDGTHELPAAREDDEVRGLRENAAQITGKRVISAAGEQIGNVGEIYYDRSGAIVGYEIKRGLFGGHPVLRAADVQTIGKDAIIASDTSLTTLEALSQPIESSPPVEPSLGEQAVHEPLGLVEPPPHAGVVDELPDDKRQTIDPAMGETTAADAEERRAL